MTEAEADLGQPGGFARLAGFLPAILLTLSALWPVSAHWAPGPILALPLYLMAASVGLNLTAGRGFGASLKAWMRAGTWLALACVLVLGLITYWPANRLLAGGGLGAVLALGTGIGLALVVLWHQAVMPILWLLPEQDPAWLRRRDLGEEALIGGAGWLAAVGFLGLLLSALTVTWLLPWSEPWYRVAVVLHAVVLAPVCARLGLRAACYQLESARARIADRLAQAAVASFVSHQPDQARDLDAALYAAARAGRIDEALSLLDSGANPHALPAPSARDQRSLPMLAAVQPDLRLLRALILAGVDINHNHAGLTALLAAVRDSYHGRHDAVLMLLTNGADARAIDAEGASALHGAARSADPGVAALLLDAGAYLDALDRQGNSALGVAAALGNLEVVRFLLDHRAACEPAGGEPALVLAAAVEDDDPAVLTALLKHKAKVNARGRLGRTALHGACLQRNPRIVAALLAAKAEPDLADEQGVTPLLEAARAGATACVDHLAAHGGIDPTACDQAGRNALAIACQSGACDSATVKALLRLGVDPRQPANDGRCAIDHAAAAGRWEHVALLDPGYVLPACLAEDDEALQNVPPRVRLRLALERGSSARAREWLALAMVTPQECASLFVDLAPRLPRASAQLLVESLQPEARDEEGNRVVWQLLALGPVADRALEAMLDRAEVPVARGSLARYLDAALLQTHAGPAAQDMALTLLARGADPFAADTGAPPLHLALHLRWHALVEALLDRGVDPQNRDRYGSTALMLACQLNDEAMVRRLLWYGAQPGARAPDGQTAQGLALSLGHERLQDWLAWPNWSLPRRPLRDEDVVAAAQAGDGMAVKHLLDLGLAVDGVDAQGCTALLRACGGGYVDLVHDLLQRGADPGLATHSGATCLSAALTACHLDVVRVLAQEGDIELDQRLPGGITALMLAAALGQDAAVQVMLENGADPQLRDRQDGTVLHALAQYGFGASEPGPALAIWQALQAADVEFDAVNRMGETPLLLLLGASFEADTPCHEHVILPQLEILLRQDVALDVRERRGFGPLHLAALHGLGAVVQRLLAAGADPNLRDALNRRPAEIALMRGYADIAAAFVPGQPVPSIARFLRQPRD